MEVFDILKQLHKLTEKITINNLEYIEEDERHFVGMSLYLTIFEDCTACIVLMELQYRTAIAVILRNALEAYADLKNLEKNANYLKDILANEYYENITFSNKCLKYNDFRKSIYKEYEKDENFNKNIIKMKEERIKNQISKKFQNADMGDTYDIIYNALCKESHNNLSVLEERHLGRDNTIQGFKSLRQVDNKLYCFAMSEMLAGALQNIYKILDMKEDEDFKKILELRDILANVS